MIAESPGAAVVTSFADADTVFRTTVREPKLRATRASAITPTRPEWIWRGWLLRRALNLLTGRQGAGKTTLAAHVAAALTRGTVLPGGDQHAPRTVAFLSLEEPSDRVVARVTAAGADLERIIVLGDVEDADHDRREFTRRWRLPSDIALLGAAIEEHAVDLVVVDGLGYAITGDSHNYATVGSALAALAAEAARTGAAILGLVHPPKGGADPATAAIGSTAWTAIPRVAAVMGYDPNEPASRVVAVGKSNYATPPSPLAFTIRPDPVFECGVVHGLRPTSVTAEQVMAAPTTHEERGERAEARQFLSEVLAAGPLPAAEVERAADAVGISGTTLKRARRDLGVVARRSADPSTGRSTGWTLELPAPEGHSQILGPLGGRDYKTPGQSQRVQRVQRATQATVVPWTGPLDSAVR